jgi:hypothetical protein
MDRLALRDALARLKDLDPLEVWPSQIGDGNADHRIRFRNNPFTTFLTADDATQDRIVSAINRSGQ